MGYLSKRKKNIEQQDYQIIPTLAQIPILHHPEITAPPKGVPSQHCRWQNISPENLKMVRTVARALWN
jgi:hypothetical protein